MKFTDIRLRDPFILVENGTYYLYGSGNFEENQPGCDVYISKDMEEWVGPKNIFTPAPDFWAPNSYWAPEVHKYNNKFYLFVSPGSEKRYRGTQIFVCDTPDGQFIPLTDEPITPEEWACLDGTLYVDKKGKPYMVFCHEWAQVGDGEMCAVALTDDLKAPLGEPFLLFKASQPEWAKSLREESPAFVTDGPFMYRTSSGRLLMTWSSFSKDGYCVGIAYSDNGEIDGKWVHDSRMLYKEDGGHGMIFKKDGEPYFILHQPNNPPFERPHIVKLEERDDTLFFAGE